jgi:hypothetical protein
MIRKLTLFSLFIWLVAGYPVLARTICVSQDVPLSQSGCAEVFTVIQDAITAAEDGDTVKIFPGLWDQNMYVTKRIVVTGTNFPGTFIHPAQGEAVVILNGGFVSCLNIKTENNHGVFLFDGTIKNCVIQGCSDPGDMRCSAIQYANNSSTVTNCIIQSNGYHGIWGNSGKVTARNNYFFANDHHAGYSYDSATADVNFNCYYLNEVNGWGWIGGIIFNDSDFVADTTPPMDANYLPFSDSPLLDKGDTAIFNPDGSRSDIGVYGGPDSCLCSVLVGVKDDYLPAADLVITPNPANDIIVVNYQALSDSQITIIITNFLGQIVAVPLQNQWQATGNRQINFAVNGLPNGSYFCTVKTSYAVMTGKFTVIR